MATNNTSAMCVKRKILISFKFGSFVNRNKNDKSEILLHAAQPQKRYEKWSSWDMRMSQSIRKHMFAQVLSHTKFLVFNNLSKSFLSNWRDSILMFVSSSGIVEKELLNTRSSMYFRSKKPQGVRSGDSSDHDIEPPLPF